MSKAEWLNNRPVGLIAFVASLLFLSLALVHFMLKADGHDWVSTAEGAIGNEPIVVNVWSEADSPAAKLILISGYGEEVLYLTPDCTVRAGPVLTKLGEEGKLKCVVVDQKGRCIGHNLAPDMAALVIFARMIGKSHWQYCIDRNIEEELDEIQERIQRELDNLRKGSTPMQFTPEEALKHATLHP